VNLRDRRKTRRSKASNELVPLNPSGTTYGEETRGIVFLYGRFNLQVTAGLPNKKLGGKGKAHSSVWVRGKKVKDTRTEP